MKNIREMKQNLTKAIEEARGLNVESMTEEQRTAFDTKMSDIDKLKEEIEREERLQSLEMEKPVVEVINKDDEGLRVFKNLGEQLRAIQKATTTGQVDERLARLMNENRAQGMNQAVGVEGGFAVQTDFAGMMMDSAAKAGNILPLVDSYQVSTGSNSVKWVDTEESTVASTVFGGVQVYWASEAATATKSKPALVEKELKLEKLMGLAYATYELEQDSDFTSQLYTRAFTLGIQRAMEAAIVSGDGKGKPIGLLTGNSKIEIAKETGQAAATILWENISKMYHRALNKDQIARYVWLAHPDTAEQFDFLSFPIGTGGVPVYLPAAQQGAVSTLKGRPVLESDHCSALGTAGDLIFTDLNDYMMIYKGGVQADTSIHVQFLTAENAFRFIFRANGMPKRKSALTIKNSSNTRSSIVTVANRA